MGPLRQGTAMTWAECAEHREEVKRRAALFFAQQYHNSIASIKNDSNDGSILAPPTNFVWGDEIEYTVLWKDDETLDVKVSLDSERILDVLYQPENSTAFGAGFHAEYARWMVEAIPASPFSDSFEDICKVEANMAARRNAIQRILSDQEYVFQMTAFPMMGVGSYSHPAVPCGGTYTQSTMTSDEMVHSHSRFRMITKNLRERRGDKLGAVAPVLPDAQVEGCREVHMDGTIFGCGMCCLQVTYQLSSLDEARFVYDQLAVVSPILMSMSAATPFQAGRVLNTDVRWYLLSQAADDRTEEERGEKPLKVSPCVIEKSRYDSIDCFVALESEDEPIYNDLSLPFHQKTFDTLVGSGVDKLLAKHVAHLCIRDPLLLMKENCDFSSDAFDGDHWLTMQSSVWQTVRLKAPSEDGQMGWRVELRPLDLQPSDFENAAFAVFSMLLTKVIVAENLRLYVPMSKVDENMKKAQLKDAIKDQATFAFRKYVGNNGDHTHDRNHEVVQMTAHEIMSGYGSHFIGLVPLIRGYLDKQNCNGQNRDHIERYLTFMQNRANGTNPTPAHWMREFVRSHPSSHHDSYVPSEALYDLVQHLQEHQMRQF